MSRTTLGAVVAALLWLRQRTLPQLLISYHANGQSPQQ
jgi:hypothetical protein